MRFPFLLLLLLTLSYSQNPCEDSLYLHLKSIDLDSMTQRQYDYFMLKEKYCNEKLKELTNTSKPKVQTAKLIVEYSMDRNYAGHKPKVGIYINDVFRGIPPQALNVSPGVHTVSLFQEKFYTDADKNDKKRMSGGIIKINVEANKVTKISFRYHCRTGINFICNDNEWSFSSEVTN
ncbi:MAG: hypothetical protein JXA54_03360 [Candidatus Heimdallarchaeota archaeon]|nr:hypothetical protein [Candidatus Heimdallarchaeota archaeon]